MTELTIAILIVAFVLIPAIFGYCVAAILIIGALQDKRQRSKADAKADAFVAAYNAQAVAKNYVAMCERGRNIERKKLRIVGRDGNAPRAA